MYLGIDFGTSNSSAAIYERNKVVFIPLDPLNPDDINVLSSALYISNNGEKFFGYRAITEYQEQISGKTFQLEKKFSRTHKMYFSDKTVAIDGYVLEEKNLPGRLFQYLKKYVGTDISTNVFGIYYRPYELISSILKFIKVKAEEYFDQEINGVVLGRPVRFSDNEEVDINSEKKLGLACKLAGFNFIEFQYEPVAAAYNYFMENKNNEKILVFDFGGGTFDASIINVQNGKPDILSIGGVPIGGYDFDKGIMYEKITPFFGRGIRNISDNRLIFTDGFYKHHFENWQSIVNLNKDNRFLKKLHEVCKSAIETEPFDALESLVKDNHAFSIFHEIEKVKKCLSNENRAIFVYNEDMIMINESISREDFQDILLKYSDKVFDVVDEVLKSAGIKYNDVNHVVRVGGSSRIPFFYDTLKQKFGESKLIMKDELKNVAAGLAVEAARH